MAHGEPGTPKLHPELSEVCKGLEGGDIEHHCARIALGSLFENWSDLIDEGSAGEDAECAGDNLMDQFDRLVALLTAIRPQVAEALGQPRHKSKPHRQSE